MTRTAREQQLLDVAEDLFLTAGYERTSIEDIARAAGITRPVVYEHYGSKEGIYLACVRRARVPLNEALQTAFESSQDPAEQFARGVDAYYTMLEGDPSRWRLLFSPHGVLTGPLADDLLRERFRTTNLIADLIEAHLPDVDPQRIDAFAHAISGSVEQLGRWWLAHPEVERATVVGYQVAFFLPAFEAMRTSCP
ncbi:transcriptional regulator, TetR family [Cryptosporangium aurantiacum]|uniref:Transcriptional regulator, TetR family n=2 Tax=Cryptosporangium aurantiacum TaxID=134849 RepID=A0A1M7RC33_9ACTN|nr:transcriptional regulator, TetR family [Cryptosporangium aurantiacum]